MTKILDLQLQRGLSSEYSEMISLKIDWFDLLAVQGVFRILLQDRSSKHQFLAFCLLYRPALTAVCDHWEDHSINYTEQSNVSAFFFFFPFIFISWRLITLQCLCFLTHCLGLS